MNLSDLQTKEIINLYDGKKLGRIIDVEISDNKIINLIVENKRSIFNIFKRNESTVLRWNLIEKIGEDVILIKDKNDE